MNTYINYDDYIASSDGSQTIPKSHRFYQDVLTEVAAGTAEIVEPVVDLATLKRNACNRIETKRQDLERAGVTISWPDSTKSTIQTRDDRDWRNINGVASRGLARITQADTTTDWFRDADNIDHVLTPTQALDMGQQAAAAISKLAKVAQATKDAINAPTVTTADQITAIEATVVWPTI